MCTLRRNNRKLQTCLNVVLYTFGLSEWCKTNENNQPHIFSVILCLQGSLVTFKSYVVVSGFHLFDDGQCRNFLRKRALINEPRIISMKAHPMNNPSVVNCECSTLFTRCGSTFIGFVDAPCCSDLAPVPLSIFRPNSKFDENSKHSSVKYTRPITTIFCTRHDSVTVVTCAEYRCDQSSIFETRAFWIFIEFRIRSKYA